VGHLVWVHWSASNTLVLAMRQGLEPNHPIRQLCHPFTHGSITINCAAVSKLASDNGGISRIGAIDTPIVAQLVQSLANSFRFETFPSMLDSKGVFPPGMLEEMPMAQDGRKLWKAMHTFVVSLLALRYRRDQTPPPTQSIAIDEPPDSLPCVEDDEQLRTFWSIARTASEAYKLPLPTLSFESLTNFLATTIFYTTAAHELLGSVTFDVTMPTSINGRVHKRALYEAVRSQGRPYQATVQDWYRIMCTTSATTLLPMPMLIPEMVRAAERYERVATECRAHEGHSASTDSSTPPLASQPAASRGSEIAAATAGVYRQFVRELNELADEIEEANATRELPFGSFNPRRLEVSVSL